MRFYKLWLILLGIGLIALDKFSFISTVRDTVVVFVERHVSLLFYRVKNYPQLLILNTTQQQELARQNVELKKQVEQYSVLLQQTKNQAQDLKNVQGLNADGMYNDFEQIVAKAVLDVNFFMNNQLLLDVGKNKNIKLGDAVVNKDGVIGQVANVNQLNSQVMLVTNQDFKIYVQSAKSKAKMLAQGGGNNTIVVNYIDKNDDIKPGDILETTGLDDVHPDNIPVAKVVKVFYENNGFNSALCSPIVNFDQLQYVLVLQK